MTIPTDGRLHPTLKNGLNVNLMDAPDFNIDQCEFHTKGPATYVYQEYRRVWRTGVSASTP